MTQVIDERVVEMKFDNKDFEKNVAESMSTLDKLKQALNFDSAKSLQELGNATKGFNLNGVGSAVESVTANFSALQVVGITAISEITKAAMDLGATLVRKVVEPIKSGGMNRALNIEKARFQLEGLKIAWEDIEDDINYAVKGTAYGLDSAAKAAAQFAAAGVDLGDDMKAALRGISGVAAMTSSSYDDIAQVFTAVSGKGKAMAAELNRLGQRGLAADAAIADYMNKINSGSIEATDSVKKMVAEITGGLQVTQQDVKDLASKGKINFEIFSKALDSAFGEHAKKANDTFTGAMDNVKAALSRIGANFATPYMENMRLIAVEGIAVIDKINKALKPVYSEVSSIMETMQKGITRFLKATPVQNGFVNIIEGVTNAWHALLLILMPIKEAFNDIFPKKNVIKTFREATEAFKEFTNHLVLSDKETENLKRTFRGLFAVLDIIKTAFEALGNALKPYSKDLRGVLSTILEFTGDIGDYIVSLRDSIKANDTFGKAFSKAAFTVKVAVVIIQNAFNSVKNGIKDFKKVHIDTKDFSGITGFFERLKDSLSKFKGVGDFLKKIFSDIALAFEGFKPLATAIGDLISSLIGGLLQGFSNAFGGNKLDAFSTFINMLSSATAASMMMRLADALSAIGQAAQTGLGLNPLLTSIKNNFLLVMKQVQADLKADVLTRLAKAVALFAGSLLVMSMINPTKLAGATVALGAILFMMNQMITGMNKLSGQYLPFMSFADTFKTQVNNISKAFESLIRANALRVMSTALIEVAVAVGILALAVRAIGKLKPEEATVGILMVTALLGELYLIAEFTENAGNLKGLEKLIAYAASVKILASALTDIAESLGENPAETGVALLMISVLLGELYAIAEFSTNNTFDAKAGFAFIELAASVLLIGKSIAMLGELPIENIVQGGIAVGAIGAALMIFTKFIGEMENMGDVGSAATAVLAFAASMWVIAAAIENLSTLNPEQIAQGMTALGIALVAMCAALKILTDMSNSGELLKTGGALALLGTSMVLLSTGISILANQDPAGIAVAIVALIAAIVGFGIAAKVMEPFITSVIKLSASLGLFSLAVIGLGAGILLLAAGIAAFNAIGPDFLPLMFEIAIAIGAFAVAAMVLQPALVPMALLAGVLVLIGVAALATGAGLVLVGMGLSTIAAVGVVGAEAVEAVAVALAAMSGAVILFTASISIFAAGLLQLVAVFTVLDVSLGVTTLMIAALTIAAGLSVAAFTLYTVGAGLAAAATSLLAASLLVICAVLGESIPVLKDFGNGVSDMAKGIKEFFINVIDDIKKSIKQKISDMVQLGKDFISGFLEGLKDIPILGSIIEAGEGIANAAISAVQKTQNSHSPSLVTEALGEDFGIGYVNGIDNTKDKVKDKAGEVAETATEELDKATDGAKETGEEVDNQLGLGLLENLPFVKDAADQVRDVMDMSDAVEQSEWDLHTVMSNYNKTMKLRKAYENTVSKDERLRRKEDQINGIERETEAVDAETEAEERNTAATGKNSKAKEEKKNVLESLKETLESQMNIFEKFEIKTDISAEQMLENMRSNLDGFASWSAQLASLTERGINKALWEKLAEMGPKGYAELNAFVQMTDEQLQQANEMFTASLAMDEAVTAQLIPGYQKLGGDIPKGLVSGLKEQGFLVDDANREMMENGLKTAKDTVKSNSPSLVYKELGMDLIEGLRLGINDPSKLIFLEDTIHLLTEWSIVQPFKDDLIESEIFQEIGQNIVEGLTQGIQNVGAQAALEAAVAETAGKIEKITRVKTGVKSPSTVMRSIGRFISIGLALGIQDTADQVTHATEMVVDDTIGQFNELGRIQDAINSELDFNPIITPMLDLSYIKAQIEDLNNILNASPISVSGEVQNGGISSESGAAQINFTQNNYSPKALSRYEIYRQTKNQIAQLKGAMG